MSITWETIVALAGAISIIGGAYVTINKIVDRQKKKKEEEAAAILAAAKAVLDTKEAMLDAKIKAVDERVEALEKSVAKDLSHIRETYNGEIRNLGQKVEDLRNELRNQHGSLVKLLTKLIENSKD